MLDFFVAILITFAATACGSKILKRVKLESISEKLIFSFGIGLGLISVLVQIIGRLGYISQINFYALLFLICIICYRELFITFFFTIVHITNFYITVRKSRFSQFLSLILITAIILNLFPLISPPIDYDSLNTHLLLPAIYLKNNIIIHDPNVYCSGYPQNTEMLFLFAMGLRSDITAQILVWFMGIGSAVLAGIFASKFINNKIGLLSAVLFYLTPLIWFVYTRTKSDSFIILLEGLTFYSLMLFYIKKDYKFLYLGSVFLGLAMGSKYTSGPFCAVPFMIVYILIDLLQNKQKFFIVVKHTLLSSVIAMSILLPWLVSNYLNTGNPVEPLYAHHFENSFIDTKLSSQTQAEGASPVKRNLNFKESILLPYYLTIHDSKTDFQSGESRIGPLFLLLIPLAFLFRKISRYHWPILVFLGLYFIIWGYMVHVSRYGATMLLFFAGLAAAGFHGWNNRNKFWKVVSTIYLFGILLFLFAGGPLLSFTKHVKVVIGNVSISEYLDKNTNNRYGMYQYINQNIDPTEKIAITVDQRYYCDAKVLTCITKNEGTEGLIIDGQPKPDVNEVIKIYKSRNINYILFHNSYDSPKAIMKKHILLEKENRSKLSEVHRYKDWILYKINYADLLN